MAIILPYLEYLAKKTVWGWRLDGHHICFSFSVNNNKLVSGTPGFLGSNPGIVQDGDQKGKEVLKTEKEMGFDLLNSLSADQLKKAIIDTGAPADIITKVVRKITIEKPVGIQYSEMTSAQKQKFLQLINLYVHRYTKLFADDMLKEIQGIRARQPLVQLVWPHRVGHWQTALLSHTRSHHDY
jgi:hypothetical protein